MTTAQQVHRAASVLDDVVEDAKLLARQEVELLKTESLNRVKNLGRRLALAGASGLLFLVALVLAAVTLVYLFLDLGLPPWASNGLVTLIYGTTGYYLMKSFSKIRTYEGID